MITGAACPRSANCRAASKPSSSPRRISISTTSGCSASTLSTASAQVLATPATITPPDSRKVCAALRNDASSSTITHRNFSVSVCQHAAPSTLQLAGIGTLAGLQESEHSQHPAVGRGSLRQAELHHEAAHVQVAGAMPGRVAGLPDNLEPGAVQEAGQALAQQDVIVGRHHPGPARLHSMITGLGQAVRHNEGLAQWTMS